MKISDLITRLTELQTEHGDLEVVIDNYDSICGEPDKVTYERAWLSVSEVYRFEGPPEGWIEPPLAKSGKQPYGIIAELIKVVEL